MPDERYFSMPSAEVGGDVRRNRALNCWPWVRSLTHSPEAVIHSPAEMVAAWPITVTTSRCPRALARRTQKPFSALWYVTRSTRPASTSWVDGSGCGLMGLSSLAFGHQGQLRDARPQAALSEASGRPTAQGPSR